MYARDLTSTRYSPLTEITPRNVTGLKQICSYALPDSMATLESSLVAVNEVLYFTTSDYTYAIDASTCALKWQVQHELQGPGGTVRGVALAGTQLFRGFRDGTIISYDIRNGEQLWSTKLTAPDGRRATVAGSPTVFDGMVYIGSEDGNLYALTPSGSLKWKFVTKGTVWPTPVWSRDQRRSGDVPCVRTCF